ncbi:MAG TPA: hypothetical protein VMD77_01025 [Candidatus Baltobacteraceae bacterium]|nr:hypothetical protein [Candidatus Baltobacteraceae bacterium]
MSERSNSQKRSGDNRGADGSAGRRSPEAGYAYFMALAIIVTMIIGSQIVMENLVTQGRREREAETVWCGNQWARAIRLYYHKTGHYPQSSDDLENGLPDLHFLRESAIKDPMERDDGSWRFIYVNSTGQIIGSVRYATLQQMALLDLNNGQIPGAQSATGLPGAVSAASLSDMGAAGSSQSSSDTTGAPGSTPPGGNASSPSVGGTTGQTPAGTAPPSDTSSPASPTAPSGSSDNSTGPGAAQSPGTTSTFGQGQPASIFGSAGPNGQGQSASALAQLTQLQPTGPVDGPVIGAFLTGVGIPTAIDQTSVRIYHGGKKYKDWEFIWNPLEDQAQAMQQGLGAPGQTAQPGQTGQQSGLGAAGANPFGNSIGTGSGAGSSGGGVQPSLPQPNQPQ